MRCVDSLSEFLETTEDEMAGTSSYVLISFHSRDLLCTLSRLFVQPGFRFFCARLAVHYLAVYSVLGSLIKQSLRATATSTMVAGVSVRYSSLFISLPLFTTGHKTTTWNCHVLHIQGNLNYTKPILKIPFL